jgi:hypothetical protein
METNKDSVIDRIRKLFALADGNANINEATAAAGMAQDQIDLGE